MFILIAVRGPFKRGVRLGRIDPMTLLLALVIMIQQSWNLIQQFTESGLYYILVFLKLIEKTGISSHLLMLLLLFNVRRIEDITFLSPVESSSKSKPEAGLFSTKTNKTNRTVFYFCGISTIRRENIAK